MRLSCSCGFSGLVPDEYAGRTVRCKKCGQSIHLVASNVAPIPEPVPVPQPIYQPAAAPVQHIVVQQAPSPVVIVHQSQALPALVNVFFPPWGHLIQGRVGAFFLWSALLLLTGLSILILVGIVLFPLCWIWAIVDAANYRQV